MSETDNSNEAIANLKQFKEMEETKQKLFYDMLDKEREKKNRSLALSASMGGSKSYISSVSLKWFSDVHFASDLDIFDEYRDDNNNNKIIAVNKDTLDMLSQRKPDWSRQIDMAIYLAVRPHRKFPPVLLVCYQDWVFNPDHDNWVGGRAKKNSITSEPLTLESLDSQESYIVSLNHENTHFYALDGQHRLMAVKGLSELLSKHYLKSKHKDGKEKSTEITLDKIKGILRSSDTDGKGIDDTALQFKLNAIMDEQIGVEIIPLVQQRETIKEAFTRLRQIFVDVNQNARKLEKGELALLDPTDGFSIVARQVMVHHTLFWKDNTLRVDTKSNQINKKTEYYTTLQTIVNIANDYLGQQEPFSNWKNAIAEIKGAGTLPPSEDDLKKGIDKLSAYFDAVMALPSHKKMATGKKISELRASQSDGGDDNILFRPFTQEALADAIGQLERDENKPPKKIFSKIYKKDEQNCCELTLTDSSSPFFGILCDPVDLKMRRHRKYKKLATEMFLYLLRGGINNDDEREKFKKEVFDSRRTTTENTENPKAIGYDGKDISEADFELPSPW